MYNIKTDSALGCKRKNKNKMTENKLAESSITVSTEQNYSTCHTICGNTDIDMQYYRCAVRSK